MLWPAPVASERSVRNLELFKTFLGARSCAPSGAESFFNFVSENCLKETYKKAIKNLEARNRARSSSFEKSRYWSKVCGKRNHLGSPVLLPGLENLIPVPFRPGTTAKFRPISVPSRPGTSGPFAILNNELQCVLFIIILGITWKHCPFPESSRKLRKVLEILQSIIPISCVIINPLFSKISPRLALQIPFSKTNTRLWTTFITKKKVFLLKTEI